MEKMTEKLVCKLSLDSPNVRLHYLASLINENIKPLKYVTVNNVNIRAMYVVNDLVNSHGGRFRKEDLQKLKDLIIDTPVLVGHDHSQAPLARTFHAEIEEKNGIQWLKSYFYWPKSAANESDDLLIKIDSGVLKECSISFSYNFPECSVCGQDMRSCPHDIDYSSGQSAEKAHFIYNGITQVLETSLVYRGSVKGTFITDKLSREENNQVEVEIEGISRFIEIPLLNHSSKLAQIVSFSDKTKSATLISNPANYRAAIAIYNNESYLVVQPK